MTYEKVSASSIDTACKLLISSIHLIPTKMVVAGFDGFIDSVVKPIRSHGHESNIFFDTIGEFGTYITGKQAKSCAIELQHKTLKYGGNMPNFSNALGCLGIPTKCIGAFGSLDSSSVFSEMSSNCELTSIANPGKTTAIEFNDGKVMLFDNAGINHMNWNNIKVLFSPEEFSALVNRSNVFGLFNWGEVPSMEGIAENFLQEVFPLCQSSRKKILFVDFSDYSHRSKDEMRNILTLIQRFREKFRVFLSLNENEFNMLCDITGFSDEIKGNLVDCGRELLNATRLDLILRHTHYGAQAWDHNGFYSTNNHFIQNPCISTGGGDNFNAGFCLAAMLEMDVTSALIIANATSGAYIKYGSCASIDELIQYLEEWKSSVSH